MRMQHVGTQQQQLIQMTEVEEEAIESIRFVYDSAPGTKILQGKSAIPAAFHYTPREKMNVPRLQYIPITCQCEAIFNYYSQINFNTKTVKCCICGNNTPLPANYSQHISPNKLPYEFMEANTTIEFKTAGVKNNSYRYGYLFVVDVNIDEKELASVRQQLANVVMNLPDHYNVGLITYGKNAKVYQLSNKINTNYCINGSKEYNVVSIMELLGIMVKNDVNTQNSDIVKRFIVPVSAHRDQIASRIRNLRPDSHIYVNERKHSCFGQALNISIAMAEVSTLMTRIVNLVGNPCTVGPGMTIGTNWKEQMRSPKELSEGQNIKYFVAAKNYYDSFTKRVIAKNIILDMFIFTLNETGFSQMSDLFVTSGGFVVMHEEFRDRIFRQSFRKIFQNINLEQEQNNQVKCDTEAVFFAYCSKEVAINGALGQCHSLNKTKPFVSSKVVGKGNTYSWYLGSVDQFKTITIAYETKEAEAKEQYYYFQLKTIFRTSEGDLVTRVTTVQKEWSTNNQQIIQGFDQEAAAVYLARHCVNKMLYEQQKNIKHIVDRTLIRWAQLFANYTKNDENSFSLPNQMKRFPQLCFHLRRSHFVNRFGISLDESFFKGYCLSRENVVNCLSMIQPALLAYSLENETTEPVSVPLDEQEMKDDVILLLDTYFVVCEWYGPTALNWEKEGYHQMEGYEHIAELFNSPKIDISDLMKFRFPVSNYYKIEPYHSKERYLKSRVNPKKGMGEEHENMITDDPDLRQFTHHLIKAVVSQS